jgi:hypothetical protein
MKWLLIMLVLCFQTSFGQKDSTIYFKAVGWTIQLPADFHIVDDASISAAREETKNDSKEAGVNVSNVRVLLAAIKPKGLFTVSYNGSSNLTREIWKKNDDLVKDAWIASLSRKFSVKPDTSNAIVRYGGVEFRELEIDFKMSENRTRSFIYLGSFYRDHYFCIQYGFEGTASKEETLHMLNTSRFDK